MRDGVYKGLPMPKSYGSLVRMCGRAVERGDAARLAARKAFEQDVRDELSRTFLRNLQRVVADACARLPGLCPLAVCGSSRELGGQNGALENDIVAQAQRLEREEGVDSRLVERALAEAFRRWRDSRIRQIDEHCIPQDARADARASAEALRTVDLDGVAASLLANRSTTVSRVLRARIDPDEDLARP